MPAGQNIIKTQNEKIERYQELAFELKKTSVKGKCHIHAVGIIFKDARTWKERLRTLTLLEVHNYRHILRKVFHILRKVLYP